MLPDLGFKSFVVKVASSNLQSYQYMNYFHGPDLTQNEHISALWAESNGVSEDLYTVGQYFLTGDSNQKGFLVKFSAAGDPDCTSLGVGSLASPTFFTPTLSEATIGDDVVDWTGSSTAVSSAAYAFAAPAATV